MASSTPSPDVPGLAPAAPAHAPEATGSHGESQHGQQHPIGLYLKIWVLLFVLSTLSYMVDYFQFEGYLRWFLILLLMVLKAGLIVGVFMHMAWERMALICAILVPPLCLLVLVGLMATEADYTFLLRGAFFR